MKFFSCHIIEIIQKIMFEQNEFILLLYHGELKKKECYKRMSFFSLSIKYNIRKVILSQNEFLVIPQYRKHTKNNVITERNISLAPS